MAVAETTDENECLAFGLPQRELEFVCAIANVEVDENGTDFGSGKLSEHPFGTVRGPSLIVAIDFVQIDGLLSAAQQITHATLGCDLAENSRARCFSRIHRSSRPFFTELGFGHGGYGKDLPGVI